MLQGNRAELADLYFDSGTVQFGAFKLAAHKENPDLPLSPVYLHYPKEGPGLALLPRIYALCGEIFHEVAEELNLQFACIGAVPTGANPIARELAGYYGLPGILLEWEKVDVNGQNNFWLLKGDPPFGVVMLAVEDHTSGGYNKKRFLIGVQNAGVTIHDFLTVVDREQGAADFLTSLGVGFHSIFTLSELLAYYVQVGNIESTKADEVSLYIANNQIGQTA